MEPLLDVENGEKKRSQFHDRVKEGSTAMLTGTGFARSVKNTGSTARDHLANERTNLAWLRTALGMLGFGIAIIKLDSHNMLALAVGAYFVMCGILVLVYSSMRYHNVMHALERGEFYIETGGMFMIQVAVGSFAILAVGWLGYQLCKAL
eukprot:TRINITY_DN20867_c0_g1_i1.p1 TRINITY_DN20867_c0_g1~~TRINITY_DN20867_c0_g1_i1.p1  ORF type:complete len:161 (-),score=26.10 TRINITY_DN20867_c0_g1_i1:65-514(-)